jgi:hypothetical protein
VAFRAVIGASGDVEVYLLTPSDCVRVTLTGADPSDALGLVGRVAVRGRRQMCAILGANQKDSLFS